MKSVCWQIKYFVSKNSTQEAANMYSSLYFDFIQLNLIFWRNNLLRLICFTYFKRTHPNTLAISHWSHFLTVVRQMPGPKFSIECEKNTTFKMKQYALLLFPIKQTHINETQNHVNAAQFEIFSLGQPQVFKPHRRRNPCRQSYTGNGDGEVMIHEDQQKDS